MSRTAVLLSSTLLLLAATRATAQQDGQALLSATAKMNAPAGWSDRRAVLSVETETGEDEVRKRPVEVKESLGENLKLSTLTEFLGPSDVEGVRVLDLWSPESPGGAWVATPDTGTFQRMTHDHRQGAGYRYAQLLDLLPRLSEATEVRVVGEETLDRTEGEEDDVETTVLDVTLGERPWDLGDRFRVWVGKDDELIYRIQAFSAGRGLTHTVTVLSYGQADGRTTATKVAVDEHARQRKNVFTRSGVQYDRGIPDSTFDMDGFAPKKAG